MLFTLAFGTYTGQESLGTNDGDDLRPLYPSQAGRTTEEMVSARSSVRTFVPTLTMFRSIDMVRCSSFSGSFADCEKSSIKEETDVICLESCAGRKLLMRKCRDWLYPFRGHTRSSIRNQESSPLSRKRDSIEICAAAVVPDCNNLD